MKIVNITLSFSDAIQQDALEWLSKEYLPLLRVCPAVASTNVFQIEAQQGADDCFALQILFDTEDDFSFYCQRYQQDFEAALVAKFTNQFGMFKTILTSL